MKVIKFIGILAAASFLFSFNAYAQEDANRNEAGEVVRGPYVTNGAFDNTFIGLGAGVNSVLEKSYGLGKIGLATDVYLGKWFSPTIGVRAGWHGINNTSKSGQFNKDPFHYIHADFLWNISNAIGGYKETRLWNFIPYVSGGASLIKHHNIKEWDQEFNAGVGLLNSIRLGDRVNLNLDLGMLVGRAAAYQMKGYRYNWVGFPTATLGLQFNLGRTGFDRLSSVMPVIVPVPFTEAQYNALKDKVAALEKENAQLKNKIADLENQLAPFKNLVDGQTYLFKNGRFTAVEAKVASPATIYFDLGSAKISEREKAHLEYFANEVDKEKELVVVGSADLGTGSAKRNEYLANKRAEAVKALLENAGFNNVTVGDPEYDIFEPAVRSRVAVIKVK